MENLAPSVVRRVAKELQVLAQNPPEGIQVIINETNLADIQAWITGPAGTPYENGYFKIRLVLGNEYPNHPPTSGEVCVNTLKKDWKSDLGITHVLLTVKCLLIVPNPESALNEEAGRLLLERYDDYAKHACLMTNIHAAIGPDQHPPTTTGVSGSDAGSITPSSLVSNVSPQELGANLPTQSKHSEVKKKAADKKKKALKRL
ncbi:ubiquitin-conjugating enzyme E2 S [Dispira parvispora]|uniref:Ubiquitin-conjugating enzyme E2 S n=1 Tax=Dispira parvispora TaxID=1520584 RepID=A0A9W8AXF2_9FUNG|nr:ubiquitin-conjugating enzyme E2 S [Dispira parvispora]